MPMNFKRLLCVCAAFGMLCWSAPSSAQTYSLSSKPYVSSWPSHDWQGEAQFPSVFCVRMPRPTEAQNMTQAMFNNNAIMLTRVTYPDNIALYIVTSTIPAGRTAEDEIGRLRESNLQGARAYPEGISVSDTTSLFGPMTTITMKNVLERSAQGPFPLTRNLVKRDDGTLMSLSVHRLFVRGPDRFEVAGLRYFIPAATTSDQDRPLAELTALVDQVVDSLQKCTSTMPIRAATKAATQP
jgi:hypothetical protein